MKKMKIKVFSLVIALLAGCSSPLGFQDVTSKISSVDNGSRSAVQEGVWGVITAAGGRVLDVQYGSVNNGSLIHLWDNGGQESALWKWEPAGTEGFFKIRNKKSGKILDVQYGSLNNGARLHLWDDVGQASGLWKPVEQSGLFKIVNKKSSLFMDLQYGATVNGTPVHQWTFSGQSSGLFDLSAFIPKNQWFLRGSFNNWQTQPMTEVQPGVFEGRCAFGEAGGEIKVDRFGDWKENYPEKNYPVAKGTWRVFFNLSTHQISLRKTADSGSFDFNQGTFYMVIPDRFLNGDEGNDHSYGRGLTPAGTEETNYKNRAASFHGGDFKGLTQKIKEGYFNDLGVNGLWISPPFEQPHGWVPDNGDQGEGYAGYWAMDFTTIDRNLGTEEEFRTLVQEAHKKGLRVLVDVVFNHAGCFTLKDAAELEFGKLKSGWESFEQNPALPVTDEQYFSYFDFSGAAAQDWGKWWGNSWARLTLNPGESHRELWRTLPGYSTYEVNPAVELPTWVLPDFKTSESAEVGIPAFLQKKWGPAKTQEQIASMDQFVQAYGGKKTVRNWVVKWLTDIVEEYGVDGYRCDTVDFVELPDWKFLLDTARSRLAKWKAAHPEQKIDDSAFWATGEPCRERDPNDYYSKAAMDSMLNFAQTGAWFTQTVADGRDFTVLESYWKNWAGDSSILPMTFISNHDFNMFRNPGTLDSVSAQRQMLGALILYLTPRAVNLYYGDEVARDRKPGEFNDLRSDFPWNEMNTDRTAVLEFWKKVGQFRARHSSIGTGAHYAYSTSGLYSFSRITPSDRVFVAMNAGANQGISLHGVFPEGSWVQEALTGQRVQVISGEVKFTSLTLNTALLEAATP